MYTGAVYDDCVSVSHATRSIHQTSGVFCRGVQYNVVCRVSIYLWVAVSVF